MYKNRCVSCILGLLVSRHFGSTEPGKLRGTRHKGRNSAVKSNQLSFAGQYKKFVQYNFKLTLVICTVVSIARFQSTRSPTMPINITKIVLMMINLLEPCKATGSTGFFISRCFLCIYISMFSLYLYLDVSYVFIS